MATERKTGNRYGIFTSLLLRFSLTNHSNLSKATTAGQEPITMGSCRWFRSDDLPWNFKWSLTRSSIKKEKPSVSSVQDGGRPPFNFSLLVFLSRPISDHFKRFFRLLVWWLVTNEHIKLYFGRQKIVLLPFLIIPKIKIRFRNWGGKRKARSFKRTHASVKAPSNLPFSFLISYALLFSAAFFCAYHPRILYWKKKSVVL